MASRRPTLSDPIDLAIAREIDSKYDDVKIVADNIEKVAVVADSIDRIDDIMTIANEVVTVAEVQADIVALAEVVEGISALYADIDVLNSLYADKAKLDSIFADKETLDSLYADKATLDSLYADKTRLDALYLNLVQINRVYQSITAVDRVALSADNVDVVADAIGSVNTASSNINRVVTVSNNIGSVNAVSADIDSVVAVAQSVVPNLDEILLVDELAAQVAVDRDDVAAMKLSVEAVYDSFDDRFLGAKNNDPIVDNDGIPLLDGAMYFNTSSNALKVYDAGNTLWVTIPQIYLSGLLDVTLTSITAGDILNWNGSKWVNTRTPSFDSIKLNGGSGAEGLVSWNADEETLDVVQNGAVLQVGQELQVHCRNNTASTIANGTVVMATGTLGASGRITVAPYDGTTDVKYVLGITTETIAAGDDGKVTTFGKVRGINTSSWTEGSVLYTTTNGGLTSTAPTSGVKLAVAFVVNSHANNGTLMVRVNSVNERANAVTASKLETARNIALTGDVTGNANFDGSGSISIAATIAANSVALGTDTTGNYVAGVTQGTGISVTGTAGEGWSPTVALTNVGTAGTYTKVTTNAQGQVTSGTTLSSSDIPSLDASKITSGTIDAARLPAYVDDVLEFANQGSFPATGESGKIYIALDTNKTYRWSGSTYVYITSGAVDSVNGLTGVVTISTITGNAGTATTLQTARTIGASGDVTGTATSFNGSANITIPMTLANSGVTAGTYSKVTVDAKGRVTAGTNPTTVAGYGLTDVYTKTESTANFEPKNTNIQTHITRVDNPHSVTKAQVGLGSVDNTSDASKPISTATQAALDLKAPLASPVLTGIPTAPTASVGTNSTQLATTAYVVAEINKIEEW